ncbi:MAG: signal peptidase I [Clostridia bacterium]
MVKRAQWYEAIALVALVLLLSFVVRATLFTVIRVDGDSMRATLSDGDLLAVAIPGLKLAGARRGDVVICHYPGDRNLYVKRVVALPGDLVAVRRGLLFLNGHYVKEGYLSSLGGPAFGPSVVPDASVFVLGDNRANSADSRLEGIGFLRDSELVGRVEWVL